MDHIPYTYYLKWSKLGLQYYGSRYRAGCHPSDFWIKYFTSSPAVAKLRETVGEPDIRIVDLLFPGDPAAARLYETWVLVENDVRNDESWVNKHDNIGIPTMSDPKIKASHAKHMESRKGNPKYIAIYTAAWARPEVRAAHERGWENTRGEHHYSKNPENRKVCEWCGEEHIVSHYNQWHGDNCKKNPDYIPPPVRVLDQSHQIKTCEWCGLTCSSQSYGKWHGDNCKQSPNYVKPPPRKNKVKYVECECGRTIAGFQMKKHLAYCKGRL